MPQCHHTAVLYYILHPPTLLKNFSRQGCHHVTPATQQDVEDPVWSGALLSYESCRKPHPCWCLQRDDGQHSVSFRNSSRCLQRDANPPPGGAVIHAVAGCTWLHAGSRLRSLLADHLSRVKLGCRDPAAASSCCWWPAFVLCALMRAFQTHVTQHTYVPGLLWHEEVGLTDWT